MTSGIRVGSAAGTTRGFSEDEFYEIGGLVARTVFQANNEAALKEIGARVRELLEAHPLYPDLV